MSDEKGPLVSQTVKDFVDREIINLKEKVYIELDARAKALELDRQNSQRKQEISHHDSQWRLGIFFMIVNIIMAAAIAVVAHIWK